MRGCRWYPLVSIAIFMLAFACGPQATPSPLATTKPISTPTQAGIREPTEKVQVTPKPVITPEPKITPAGEMPYYQGKTIEIFVGGPAGGGTDIVARFIASYLPKYIPGNPKIIVRDFAAAQGITGTNIFSETAKPNGFTLLVYPTGAISAQITREPIVKFDLRKFRHIGNVARAESILIMKKGLRNRLMDPRAEPLINASGGGGETAQALPLWGKEFLGWNVRWLLGFAGTPEMELSFRRGEIQMFGTSTAFVVRRMLDEGLAEPVVQIGSFEGGKLVRRPDFPEVPTMEELLGDKKPTGVPWQAYLAVVGPGLLDKPFAAPAGTPDTIMNILVDAFTKMAKDPEFDAMVKKSISEVYEIGIGKDTDAVTKQILETSPDSIDYINVLKLKNNIIAR